MEAVPKLPLINFELKSSPENTHFGPKLKQYIAEAYREDPESYSNEIHQMESLRSVAVRPTMDADGLSGLNKYFCQLRSLQSRFPMAKGQPAAVSFSWRDLYAHMSCSLADIRFEMACILYNIGALHSYLGASEPRNSADSLKAACTHYQNAAWAFQYLKEQYPQPPGVDVSTEIMRLLQKICFAQAQECILEKSIQDTRKPSVVGAVATQVLLFYKNALAVLGPSAGSDNIHEIIGTKLYNYWHRYLSFKAGYIGCIVCLYQGMNAEEQQKMGERVAFYQLAVDRLNDARKLSKYIEPVQVTQEALTFTNDVVEGKRKAAKNENEFIYHEEVPEKDLLAELKPVCLVKALAINFNDPEVSGPDVFARLVPICAHEASSLYSEEKAKILRHIVTQAESKNTELTEFMSSLQLDQLEVIDSDQKIPQDIVDRCAAMNAKSEIIQTLVDSMNSLAEIISDVEHSLAEVKNLIQEETLKEKEYQKSMGPRPPSIVQTELSREYHKYHEAHTRTNESNQVLHKAMTLHIANLKLLAQPLDELQAKIPSIDNIEGLDRETMSEMRRVVAKAREMQTQRDSLIQSLREDITNDDITSQLLARSSENTEDIFKEQLEKHNHKVKIIEQNLVAQENIINKLTALYASYGESRRMLSDVLRKRDGLINALITSYDAYEELLAKSQKGLDFYKKLLHNVNQLLTRLKGTCQVQEEERSQLLAKNNKPSTPTPSLASSTPDISTTALPPAGASRKLKDYLPYMKKTRGGTPQAMESIPSDAYYSEQMYPPSVRPTPVGSEATDIQMQLPDGMSQIQNQQDRYYAPETDPYASQHNYPYAATSKVDKPDENYAYSSPYTPQQYSMVDPSHSYSNSYYSATHNSNTNVTDSQNTYPSAATPNQYGNPSQNQANVNPNPYANQPASQGTVNPNQYSYDPYSQTGQSNAATPIPDVVPAYNSADLNSSFSQMHVSAKSEPAASFGQDYTQTFFNVQYPLVTNQNFATYTPSMNTSTHPNMIQTPSDFSSLNYPYSDANVQGANSNNSMGNNAGNPAPNMGNSYSDQHPYGQMSNPQGSANTNVHAPANHSVANSQAQMTNPNMQGQMANPNIQAPNQNMSNPNMVIPHVQGQMNNPNIQGQMTNPNIQGQMTNPNMQGQMTNPNMQGQMTNPNIQGQMTNPNIQGQMTNPNMQGQMTNPNIQTHMSNPNMVNPNNQAQTAPPVNSSMANPVVNPYEATQYNQTNIPNASIPNVANPYSAEQYISSSYSNVSLGYPTYTNAENTVTSTTNTNPQANFPPADQAYANPSLAHLDAIDKPIKSHVTGEALSSHLNYKTYQNYGVQSVPSSTLQPTEQNYQPNNAYGYSDQPNVNYSQGYQNHPGYTFNNASGGYDYSYGSQNAYAATTYDANQGNANLQQTDKNPNLPAQSVYTSAGAHATLQSPSGTPQLDQNASNNQIYYNTPYGYITNTNQAQEMVPNPQAMSTNYGANVNQSTYMQSGQGNTNTTNTNQVSSPTENIQAPNFEQNSYSNVASQSQGTDQSGNNQLSNQIQNSLNAQSRTGYNQAQGFNQEQQTEQPINSNQITLPISDNQSSVCPDQNHQSSQNIPETQKHNKPPLEPKEKPEENTPEPSVFDLLSDIDFTVKTKVLKPEIKVPQISESSIKKPLPKPETVKKRVKDGVPKRPAKREIFGNPSLLNQFMKEVNNLQTINEERFINKEGKVLDIKWKAIQDLQNNEYMKRSKTIAMQHTSGSIATEVVPYDDYRLTLKCDPDAYLNANLFKHQSSWCIPLVISATPSRQQMLMFWRAVLENEVTCLVCLQTADEIQGKVYWPTMIGTSITLPGVTVQLENAEVCLHWTKRKLKVVGGGAQIDLTHIQMHEFPAQMVYPPLLLLVDEMINLTSNTAWIHCKTGGGRSAVIALLCMLVCQVRAGQVNVSDILDKTCVQLVKKRCNALEDKKYLVDAHLAAQFYVQGVISSGTTSYNGLKPSLTLPDPPSMPTFPSTTAPKQKFSRESFEEMKQSPGLKSGDMKDPLNFLDPLWSLKKK